MFEERAVRPNSLANTGWDGTIDGFSFAVRLPLDRGLWLSLIGGFHVAADGGEPFPQSALTLHVNGKAYPVPELANYPNDRWNAFQEAELSVKLPGGLEPEKLHSIDFGVVLLCGYFKAKEEWVQAPPKPGESGKACRFICQFQKEGWE